MCDPWMWLSEALDRFVAHVAFGLEQRSSTCPVTNVLELPTSKGQLSALISHNLVLVYRPT